MATNVEVWGDYAKDRFESAVKRVDEFRNWARQLSAAVAVVVGLELTLVGKVLELPRRANATLLLVCVAMLLLAVVVQLLLLVWLLFIGYRSQTVRWPESPLTLAKYVADRDELETRRLLGAYYAKAYDQLHQLSISVGIRVGHATATFTGSMLLLFLGVAVWIYLALTPYNLKTMDTKQPDAPETQASPPATGPSSVGQDGPSQPQTETPLLVTPTPGDLGRASQNEVGRIVMVPEDKT